MSSGSRGRGFTLLETLVACALSVLLLVLSFQVLVPTLRASARASARVEMQQQALVCLDSLTRNLSQTQAAGCTLLDAGGGRRILALHPLDGLTTEGEQVWAEQAVVYDWQDQTLRIKHSPPLARACPKLFEPAKLLGLPPGDERVLARGLVNFQVQPGSVGPGLGMPMRLTLELSRSVSGSSRPEGYRLQREVVLAN